MYLNKLNGKDSYVNLTISPARVGVALGVLITALTLASLAGTYAKYYYLDGQLNGLVRLFNLDAEASLPTWFEALFLFSCALLLAWIGMGQRSAGKPYVRHWLGLALIFALMSLDEIMQFHELTIRPLRALLGTGGFLYFAWIVPAAVFVLLLAVLYFKFLLHLPAKTAGLFVAAAVSYVGGTLAVEAIGGRYEELHGMNNIVMALLTTLEEMLEMVGVGIFIYALLAYISEHATLRRMSITVTGLASGR